jgi:signal transduction histidine kinase/ActR/RegA family two-component response regulator
LPGKNVQGDSCTALRCRAEERARDEAETDQPVGTWEDPLKLHHELQVHRLELEMQNVELRQTRDELEAVLGQYTDLYDFAPVGYVTLDREGTISRVNFTATSLAGAVRSRLIGRNFRLFVAYQDRPVFTAFLGRVFVSLAKETCEVALLKEGNSPLFVQIEAVVAASGEECRIALFDITASKLIREVEAAAREALQKIEESVTSALFKVEKSAAEALLMVAGLTASSQEIIEVARLKVEEATEIAGQKVEKASEVARLKVEETAKTLQLDDEATGVAVQKVKNAIKIAHLIVEKAAGVARRAVLAEATNQEIRKEKESAEAATRVKSQFLANMSHELRTPMTGVLGMLDLVLLGNLEAEQREFINAAHASARSLVLILNDILDMTKIEMGKFSIEAKPFSLRKCAESTFNILFPAAKNKGLAFHLIVADNVPETLIGDKTRLNQVLTNLGGNAVKFTNLGKVEMGVAAGGSTSDGRREITFTVTDTGIGIPADKRDRLFQVFSQVDESHSRSHGGTGLGLAISKEIVESMGGTIRYESEEGVGSTFSFTVPLREGRPESDVLSAINSHSPETVTAPEGEKIPYILLAEDDPNNRMALGLLLKWAKFRIDFAEDGLKAVEMWETGKYDLVLMDIQMPLLNGFEVTRAIREKEQQRGGYTPIIAMTAHAFKEDEERCLASGMDSFISKPLDIDKCIKLIGQIIQQKSCRVN